MQRFTTVLVDSSSVFVIEVRRGNIAVKSSIMLFPLLKINVPLVEQKILSYIGPEDLVSVAFVCKEWYRAVGNKRTRACLLKAVETGCEHLVTYILEDFNESGEWIGWGLIGTAFVHAADHGLLVSIENGVSVDVLMINRHYVKSSVAVPILLPR